MGFSLQDPADSPTACSPPLPPAGIPQNEGVSLNSDEVSSSHLPDKLVLSIKGAMNPISPSLDPHLAESLWFPTCIMAISLPSVQCKFLLPSVLLAISMRFSNGGKKIQVLQLLTCLELPLAFFFFTFFFLFSVTQNNSLMSKYSSRYRLILPLQTCTHKIRI